MTPSQHFPPTPKKLMRFHPSALLLIAQLFLLVLFAIFDDFYDQRSLISAFSVLVLVLVIWVVRSSSTFTLLTWGLAIPTIILSILSTIFLSPTLIIISSLLEALLYFYTAGSLISYMLSDERVTTDELFALGATFTLLAWGYAYLFLACQTWVPSSFFSSFILDRSITFLEFLSLSFTNLTATGLGDIIPVTPAARILVMLAQFTGVGYVAVVVTRLISLTTKSRSRK